MTFCVLIFFILRFILFYRNGIRFFQKENQYPKLSEVRIVFLSLGIIIPLLLSFIPILGIFIFIGAVFAFIKSLLILYKFEHPQHMTPEKIAFVGFGMGVAGIMGFVLGCYRSTADNKTTVVELKQE